MILCVLIKYGQIALLTAIFINVIDIDGSIVISAQSNFACTKSMPSSVAGYNSRRIKIISTASDNMKCPALYYAGSLHACIYREKAILS